MLQVLPWYLHQSAAIGTTEVGSFEFLELKYRRGHQRIQSFCKIGFPQGVRSPLFNLRKFRKAEKNTSESCKIYWNVTNDEAVGSFKFLKLKYWRRYKILQSLCRIGYPQEIRLLPFNLWKFWKNEKSTVESCRMGWNLMNDEEFGSFKFFEWK